MEVGEKISPEVGADIRVHLCSSVNSPLRHIPGKFPQTKDAQEITTTLAVILDLCRVPKELLVRLKKKNKKNKR